MADAGEDVASHWLVTSDAGVALSWEQWREAKFREQAVDAVRAALRERVINNDLKPDHFRINARTGCVHMCGLCSPVVKVTMLPCSYSKLAPLHFPVAHGFGV